METSRRQFIRLTALAAAGGSTPPAWAIGAEAAAAPGTVPAPDAIYALVDHCRATRYEDLPAGVAAATRTQILDTVAVALPARGADGIRQLYDWSRDAGGKGKSRSIRRNKGVSQFSIIT